MTASSLLGALIGIYAKNQQAAAALVTPTFMILSFTPLIALYNESVAKAATFLFTQQVNVIAHELTANAAKPFLIISANIAVLLVLFILVYRKKGLRLEN